uniref:Interleukin-1 receptor type 1-like isoform X2 n=1 Tax=Geotrypetes seraphini TaxID=260995 RepID=A0A6P8R2U4_GEOSA|nr:interleukin-1 receptor type 1-like isoform X2 [Geotrypetes seraphini]XP_033804295.1 interleukin-1 receptor type 1-like isoform X2 [Geotrypetes seraphini]
MHKNLVPNYKTERFQKNMKPALLFPICIIFECLASICAEDCHDCGVEFHRSYIVDGQPGFVSCPLCYWLDFNGEVNYNFTWSKNGSTAHVTTERHARVYQDGRMLKFIPARLEDSGYYQCVVWNSTNCFKKLAEVIVFQNDNGLCYNKSIMYLQSDPVGTSGKMVCADLSDYVDKNSVQVRWYKECKPLDTSRSKFTAIGFDLTIENMTKDDEGNYTCEVTYAYDEKLYNISRAIGWTVNVYRKRKPAVIIFPKNNSIEVELGCQVSLVCSALYSAADFTLSWNVNDMFAKDYYNSSRIVTGMPIHRTLEDGTSLMTVHLNISEVKKEDYENKFACVLQTSNGLATEFLFIKHPAPNFQGGLIAIFVALALVIVIAVLTYKVFRVDIILWHRQSCFYHHSIKEDGKTYDAYVMFPKSGNTNSIYPVDTFVLKVLPEVLERQCGYRLFILGRDELPGEAIADVVDKTMNECRRLIIILAGINSRDNFFENVFEQQIALYDALVSNKVKAILIELEKTMDYKNMPESIKYIKQKQGVIRWKGNFTDSSLLPYTRFWKNVRYRMPPAKGLSTQTLLSNSIPPSESHTIKDA